jgi:diguanylate cyclase (GGDEF)-like protein/PAS domain S-box-containing protein
MSSDPHDLLLVVGNDPPAAATIREALSAELERVRVTLDSIGDGVVSTDNAGNVTYLNSVAERMTGWSREEATGRMFSDVFRIIDGDTRGPSPNPMDLALRPGRTVGLAHNAVLVRRDGTESAIEDSIAPIHDRGGGITGAVMVFRDVSRARAMEVKLSHLAEHDVLTDLPNRMLLNDRLNQAISLARRHRSLVAVLFLDLDRFKHVNDSLGHAVGDRLLQEVGKRLTEAVRDSDTVSRHGGDEFVVVLSEVEHARNAAQHAEKLHASLSAPHAIAQHDLRINASIGISMFPRDGQDAETLVRCADTAMYEAKESGRNTHRFFEPAMSGRVVRRHVLDADLCCALERRQFVLHYQPKTDFETGAVTGAEALIRWAHPERGLLAPEQFLPLAEESGLIVPIGQWVIREACGQARAWQNAGLPRMTISVNISGSEFRHKDFPGALRAILAATQLEPRYLELEMTESVLMRDAESAAVVLQGLKSMGVRLAIDDFGTGYSNLRYLRQFPIDALKIDRTFVHDSTTHRDNAAIVSALISLGKGFGLRVVAEGVETREQLALLTTRCCDEGQGYYFGRPVVAGDFEDALGTDTRPPYKSSPYTTLSAR